MMVKGETASLTGRNSMNLEVRVAVNTQTTGHLFGSVPTQTLALILGLD